MKNTILITSPNLDTNKNVSGISAVTNFIINKNKDYHYRHFELGKLDNEKRGIYWFLKILKSWIYWFLLLPWKRKILIHFNLSLDKRSIIRDLPLVLYAQMLNIKMVIHLHGGLYLEKESVPKSINYFLTFSFSRKDTKIVLSPREKELITEKYNAKGVVILPNSIDLNEAQNFNRSYSSNLPLKLLFIGRIDKNKGIDYIFQALSNLKEKNIQFKFIMAGNGPDKKFYVQKFSTGFQSDFEFKGVVSGNEKTELFKECNVFLLPSFFEGLPISLLECMSFGIVPIVTNVGSMKYIVKDGQNGFLINTKSSTGIVKALENLSNNSELLQKLGDSARQLIYTDFDPIVYIEKLNSIYDRA